MAEKILLGHWKEITSRAYLRVFGKNVLLIDKILKHAKNARSKMLIEGEEYRNEESFCLLRSDIFSSAR